MPNSGRDNKVIVIGAGVAGLTAGSYLARNGFQVTVLEANPKIGGCCGTTEIDGYTFNDGAQYLIYPNLLDLVFSQLGFDRQELIPLRRVTTPATTHLPNGTSVSIGEDFQITVENGDISIPLAQRELAHLFKKWAPVDEILTGEEFMLSPLSAGKLLSKAWMHLPKFARTLKGELEQNFSEPLFRSALAAHVLYAGAPLDKLPAVSIIALVNGLKDGMALPEGGMGKIPEALAYTFEQYGGEIHVNTRVKNIRIQNGRVCGVQVDKRRFVEADFVISTVNAMATYQFLLEESDQPKQLVRKAKRTPLSMSAFCVQLGVSNPLDVTSHIHYYAPILNDLNQFFQSTQDKADWGYYSVPTVVAPELAPDGKSIIEYVPVIRQGEPTQIWSDERIEHFANESIDWLTSRHVMNIEVKRIRSPREFEKQLNLYHGAIYGVSAAKGLTGLFPHKSPIDGLYLAGQTTYPGLGIPTAALSGIHASKKMIQNIE
jgi:phytoene desaturase